MRINQDAIAAGKVGAEAAVARLIGQLDDFDRAILSARLWAPTRSRNGYSLSDLACTRSRCSATCLGRKHVSLNCSQIRRIRRSASTRPSCGRRLGPYLPADVVDVELRRLGMDPSGQTAEVLLHVAGPYRRSRPVGREHAQRGATRRRRPLSMQSSYANLHHPPTPCCMP